MKIRTPGSHKNIDLTSQSSVPGINLESRKEEVREGSRIIGFEVRLAGDVYSSLGESEIPCHSRQTWQS